MNRAYGSPFKTIKSTFNGLKSVATIWIEPTALKIQVTYTG